VVYARRQMLSAVPRRTMAVMQPTPDNRTTAVRRVERGDIEAAARTLAAAFHDDPVCRFAWPNDDKRLRRSDRSFASQIRILWNRREVHTDDQFSSVAVWARPGEWQIPNKAVARVLATSLRTRVRMAALLAYLRTDALHPEEPHWYLEFLGTAPDKQGKGCGALVLARGLAQADEEGLPVWTWSSNQRNLAFYHRHGFEVLDELPFARGGPPIFPIRRDPRQ
jgi:GNAT superfamily N-acetyltransferase